jgi:transglutaminase-like putative cysteine protease
MTTPEKLTSALVIAWALSSCALFPVTVDRQWLWMAGALVLASVLIAVALRRLRVAEFLVKVAQLVPGVAFWYSTVLLNPADLLDETATFVLISVPPMEPHTGFRLFTIMALWIVYMILDLVVVSLEQAPWSFPLLFVPYLIPGLAMVEPLNWRYFCLGAGGYLLLLIVSGAVRNRPVGRVGLWFSGITLGAVCLAGALLLGVAIPYNWSVLDWRPFANPTITLSDPSVDIQRNLRATKATKVLSYTTDVGHGVYLRLIGYADATDRGFSSMHTELQRVDEELPVGAYSGDQYTMNIEMGDFASQYLPLPLNARTVQSPGTWAWDPVNDALVTMTDNQATVKLKYQLTATDFSFSDEQIATSQAGATSEKNSSISLPSGLSPEVIEMGRLFNDTGDRTAGEIALAIRDWLLSDEFTYSTAAVRGSAMETVDDFLLSSRSGYCEQFAASFALLARIHGIPSRVVVGFLPGSESNGTWTVDTHDMHAWVELNLDGLGWVPFDVTPGGDNATRPTSTPSTSASSSPRPSSSASARPTATPTPRPGTGRNPAASLPAWIAWVAGGLGLLILLLAGPRTLRALRRRRRLNAGQPFRNRVENAWDELRDRVLDAGVSWPVGTLRETSARLSAELESGGEAISELAELVEQVRFAPQAPEKNPVLLLNAVDLKPQHKWFPASIFKR